VHDSRRTRLVLGVLLAVALALITLNARNSSSAPVRGLRSLGGAIFGTAESVVSGVSRPVTGFLTSLGSASHSQATINSLEREVVQLRGELSQAQISKADEAQLQQLLQLAGRGRYRIVPATVVAAGPAYEDAVTIGAGSADGITTGETVLNGAGFVGVITSVSAHTSTVLLDTDGSSRVGVRVAPSGAIGLVTGTSSGQPDSGMLRLQVLKGGVLLQPGDQVATFGGWPFAPGVPVGVITRVVAGVGALTEVAYVRPYVRDSTLGVVGVIVRQPRHNPLLSLVPPRPTPSPTPTPTGSPRTPAKAHRHAKRRHGAATAGG
jgi:rod shape-determining protein MreC